MVGEEGFGGFLYSEVSRRLEHYPEPEDFEVVELPKHEGFSDLIQIGREFVSELKSLPYKYMLTVPLPEGFSKEYFDLCQDFILGDGVSIQSGQRLAADFPVETGVERRDETFRSQAGEQFTLSPDPKALYLVQRNSGYVGVIKDAPVLNDFRSTLRQFLGIARAVGIFKTGWPTDIPGGFFVVHRVDAEKEIVAAEKIPQQLVRFYSSHRGAEPPKATKDVAEAKKKLEAVKAAFSKTEHGKRLSVAAMWYLRSIISQETLDGLLEATIAIEALFGGGSSESGKLSVILANRCAYRITSSVSKRTEILDNFKEIYDLRSRIVHEGHHRFSAKERKLLKEAREICRRALVLEATLKP